MSDKRPFFDVAVIGAGLAGIMSARQLQQKGLNVVVLEKSRGVGGRVATRRIDDLCVDHGLSYLSPQGNATQKLIESLLQQEIVMPWTSESYNLKTCLETAPPTKRYIAPEGMTAIAKHLSEGLTLWRNSRVITLIPTEQKTWYICLDKADSPTSLEAKGVIMAIPALQALMLLQGSHIESFPPEILAQLQTVSYDPCIAVVAGYAPRLRSAIALQPMPWQIVNVVSHPDLAWIGLDSSKRTGKQIPPTLVLHSSTYFAQQFLNSPDLQTVGKHLLHQAAQLLLADLDKPQWHQVHRWRYAFPRRHFPDLYLATRYPLPLICCGDWCLANIESEKPWHIERALTSGLAAATAIGNEL